MRRLERLALWIFASYALCGCTRTTEVKTEAHEELQQVTQQRESQVVTQTVQTGPETITTTTEEYEAVPVVAQDEVPGTPKPRPPSVPVLVKRIVTVDQRGPVLAETHSVAKEAAQTVTSKKADAKTDTTRTTRYGPPWWLLAVGGVVLAAAGYAVWRFSLFGRIAKLLA